MRMGNKQISRMKLPVRDYTSKYIQGLKAVLASFEAGFVFALRVQSKEGQTTERKTSKSDN